MQAKKPKYVIVVDHGSVEAPAIVDSSETRCLLIDHHLSDDFPKDAIVSDVCYLLQPAIPASLTHQGRLRMPLPTGCHIIASDLRDLQRHARRC